MKRLSGRPEEARLVDTLRAHRAVIHSLVARLNGPIAGHALFTPILIHRNSGIITVAAALGPVAVLPSAQKQGIGTALITAGIALCRAARYPLLIVLGHPDYYPRFGFQPAASYGITSSYDVPEDAFMVLELQEGALASGSGVAYYHTAFDGV